MAALSGKFGEVRTGGGSNILELLSWDLEYGAEPQEYASRAGGGATQAVAGVESGSGTIEVNFDPDDPIAATLSTGATVTLTLRFRNTPATVDATGQAVLGKHSYGMNRDGTVSTVSIPFVTHGSWTLPT